MKEIDFAKIEKKWQDEWEKKKIFEVKDKGKNPYYVLEMFPYPSGNGIHMGHAFNYTLGDILARYKLMCGFNVLHPMGFDSLGLPAENAAIKNGTHPRDYTNNSIPNFVNQQKTLGLTYDWSRVFSTSDKTYYRWDQWIFLKMFERGLAYQKTSAVNWCKKCNTVLANEQVHDGRCWRHGDTNVEIRYLKQWFLKITEYADELYEGLGNMNWPDKTRSMQKNWIGRSYGTEIDFKINGENWSIFTTRPDTIFGVTFMVVAAQHPKLYSLVTLEQKENVDNFLKKLKSVSEKDIGNIKREGVFTGSYAKNPANGESVPVYIGNFVVADYGTGMVMAVPAHDERDFEFAKKYEIEIRQVISCMGNCNYENSAYTGSGNLVNSGEFNGLKNVDAKNKITSWLIKKKLGRKIVNFKLRDWGISRQRYWGAPIPIIHCEKCGTVPVPEIDLPVELPNDIKFGNGNPLETNEKWLNIKCPKCGGRAKRESDTMDTFVNSSWYFLRYCDAKNSKKIFDPKKVKYWCPVDTYIGGAEHACMHLIYSRFYVKFLRDLGLIDFDEPAIRLFHQGMINGNDGEKMSKSKGNGIDPLKIMKKYGVDTTRFFLVSVAAPDKGFNWTDNGIHGSSRFINKIMTFFEDFKNSKDNNRLLSKLNRTIMNVGYYYNNFEYRKATIEIRELFNEIDKGCSRDSAEKFLKILNPICPHITEELWNKLGNDGFISTSPWPETDEKNISKKEQKDSNLNFKIINRIKEILSRINNSDRNKKINKIYVYVMPFEIEKVDAYKISKSVGKNILIYSVSNPKKIDPMGIAKRARPDMAAIYLE